MTGRLTRRRGGSGAPARLRELLNSGQTVVAPGAFDPLAARLVEEAGFAAVYMTGFGTSAALLGRPDVGLLTMTEMVAKKLLELATAGMRDPERLKAITVQAFTQQQQQQIQRKPARRAPWPLNKLFEMRIKR